MFILAAAIALASDERLVLPMADGFMTGYQQTAATGSIEERVPRGETVEDWSRMITLLSLNIAATPEQYLSSFIGRIQTACPGAIAAPLKTGPGPGPRNIEGRLDCPRNPSTGKPETFVFRLFQGAGRLFMVQAAFRHVPDAREIGWADAQLASVVLCGAGSADRRCTK